MPTIQNMLNKSYKTKSTVHPNTVAFAIFALLCELSNEMRTAGSN